MVNKNKIKFLKTISNIKPISVRVHGGKNILDLPNKDRIIDFSVSINPYGPPPEVELMINYTSIREYPDPESKDLRKLIASLNNVNEENVFIGNGSAEIIALLFFCFVGKKDRIASLWPSFGDYHHYTRIIQAKFIPINLNPPAFRLNLNTVSKMIEKHQPKLFFFCNPNNPTGNYHSEQDIAYILERIPKNTLFILDEAYANLVLSKWNSVNLFKQFKNIIILRSLTKDYALTALRLGYSIASKEITDVLKSASPSWNINSMAQRNGLLILKNKTFLKKSVLLIHKEKNRIEKALKKLGYGIIPSAGNFYLLKVKNAKLTTSLLLTNNIYVRDCTDYGLPQYLRISIKLPQENDYLLKVLDNLVYKINP